MDDYVEAGIYDEAEVPFQVVEQLISEDSQRTVDEVQNIGILGGLIADEISSARKDGSAVCMTGGNCCHITGWSAAYRMLMALMTRIGLVWFDAHGDYNTSKTTLSGMLGGMPVAVAAGLTHANWRVASHVISPLPTERIVLVDVRNLDPAEEQLIRATDTVIASVAPGFHGDISLQEAVRLPRRRS